MDPRMEELLLPHSALIQWTGGRERAWQHLERRDIPSAGDCRVRRTDVHGSNRRQDLFSAESVAKGGNRAVVA
jgi:hypothetical protein